MHMHGSKRIVAKKNILFHARRREIFLVLVWEKEKNIALIFMSDILYRNRSFFDFFFEGSNMEKVQTFLKVFPCCK